MEAELRAWRKAQRESLIARRLAVPADTLRRWRSAIDDVLERTFPQLSHGLVGFCWPFKNEYDPRHLLARLRNPGMDTALPVVLAKHQPLVFREWHPGTPMARGVFDIPYPADGPAVDPDTALVPMNGFDRGGYRLGYGGGFFDRTLAARATRPLVIGVAYELARLDSIDPQPHDIPMDYVVTEAGVYQRRGDALRPFDGTAHASFEGGASGR